MKGCICNDVFLRRHVPLIRRVRHDSGRGEWFEVGQCIGSIIDSWTAYRLNSFSCKHVEGKLHMYFNQNEGRYLVTLAALLRSGYFHFQMFQIARVESVTLVVTCEQPAKYVRSSDNFKKFKKQGAQCEH